MGYNSIEPYVRELFEWYAPLSYRIRWPLVVIPLCITLICSVGFLRLDELRIDDPSYVFTPKDARWRRELKVFTDTWPLQETKFLPGKSFETKRFVNALIKSKDGGNILREPVLREIQMLNEWIMHNISVPTDDKKYNLTFQDLCMSYDWVCMGNEHIEMLLQRQKVGKVIDLSYPRGGNQDTPVYLGTTLGDVMLYQTNHTVKEAKITQLFYFMKQEEPIVAKYSSDFSYAVERFLLKIYTSDLIEVSFAHYQSLQDGLDENADRFVPNFIVSFTSLSVYALVSAFCLKRRPFKGIDMIKSKPYLAVAGLLTTLMSIASGFGFLMLLGVNYNVINTIIPFLIIAIGIDDMFIMCACWEQSDQNLPVTRRLAQTLAHAGVAVTITNITDILSFAIGCITDLPGIQLFCMYACVSVAFCYAYQLTFFCGVMAIMGEAEEQRRHCVCLYRIPEDTYLPSSVESQSRLSERSKSARIYPENIKQFHHKTCFKSNSLSDFSDIASNLSSSSSGSNILHASKSCQSLPTVAISSPPPPLFTPVIVPVHHTEPSSIVRFIGEKFGPFLLTNPVRFSAVICFLAYLGVAAYGCFNFREGLNPGNLVTNDHYIAKYFEDIKKFWKSGPQLHVAVLQPPNLVEGRERERLLDMVTAFENTPYTMGREGTVFFLLEYLNYLEQLNAEVEDTERLWKQKLRSWLKYTGGASQWEADIKYNKTEIAAFRFQIAMKNIIEPNQHKLAAKTLREIADAQPFDVEIYYEAFPFADQYLIILPATIQNVAISLLCMTVVSILLVPSLPSGAIIFVSIVSINVGVFGYMTLWGVNLDAVSMISIIMSIGFAVDLSAHIIYAFVTSHGDSRERVIGALEALGWPIFQGASSTILGISVLYTVDAYIILTFFKTIWLTMMIGAIHGLFFIPVLLSFIPIEFFRIPKNSELH